MLLQGLFVPLTCPFYRDGGLYLRKLEHNVARYSLSPAAGLIALAPGGEAGALTDAEALAALQSVATFAGKTKVLLAGIESRSVAASLERIAEADRLGFDAVLLAPPSDWAQLIRGQDGRELVVFYETLADRSSLPLVLWSESRPPSLQLPVEVLASLARHANILGVLDADLDPDRVQSLQSATADVRREVTVTTIFEAVTRRMLQPEPAQQAGGNFVTLDALSTGTALTTAPPPALATPAIKTRSKTVGFQILSAAPAQTMVPLLTGGASGAAPTLAACAPQGCFEAYAAWKDGDPALAAERAHRLGKAQDLLTQLGPAAIKAGCDFNGYFGGFPRLPRLPLTADNRTAVEQALAQIRN